MRLLDVRVWQRGELLYHAELGDHATGPMSGPLVDAAGLDPTLPPSGPTCEAEVPRRIHVEVPDLGEDVMFRYDSIAWNPPLPADTFVQSPREGMALTPVACDE